MRCRVHGTCDLGLLTPDSDLVAVRVMQDKIGKIVLRSQPDVIYKGKSFGSKFCVQFSNVFCPNIAIGSPGLAD